MTIRYSTVLSDGCTEVENKLAQIEQEIRIEAKGVEIPEKNIIICKFEGKNLQEIGEKINARENSINICNLQLRLEKTISPEQLQGIIVTEDKKVHVIYFERINERRILHRNNQLTSIEADYIAWHFE